MAIASERTLGRVLKEYRERAKLTQEKLAYSSGINQSTIADIELGNIQNTNIRSLRRICLALHLNPLEILDIHGWDAYQKDLDFSKPLLFNRYEDDTK